MHTPCKTVGVRVARALIKACFSAYSTCVHVHMAVCSHVYTCPSLRHSLCVYARHSMSHTQAEGHVIYMGDALLAADWFAHLGFALPYGVNLAGKGCTHTPYTHTHTHTCTPPPHTYTPCTCLLGTSSRVLYGSTDRDCVRPCTLRDTRVSVCLRVCVHVCVFVYVCVCVTDHLLDCAMGEVAFDPSAPGAPKDTAQHTQHAQHAGPLAEGTEHQGSDVARNSSSPHQQLIKSLHGKNAGE